MLSRSTIFVGLMLTGSLALASFMREDASPSSDVVLPVPRASSVRADEDKAAAYPALQLEKLARAGLSDPEHNPFAGKSWYVPRELPPVVQTLKENDQPSAPTVPFKYIGRLQEEGGRPVVFFSQGSRAYSVHEGETIDSSYRLDSVSPTQLVLVYLPLKTKQTIEVSPLEADPEEGFDEASSDTNVANHRELQTQGELQEASRDE
jgi:hypothetical protein